jgi:hypothetical protein
MSQKSKYFKETLPIKPKDIKVKFRHYNSKEKVIKVAFDIIGTILLILFGFLIIFSIITEQYTNITIYIILLFAIFIPIEIVEGKIKKNAQKRLFDSMMRKREEIASQIRYPIQDKDVRTIKDQDILVFVSYATKDAEIFKVRELSEVLTKQEKIANVLYWQEDMKDNIIKYMNDNLGNCDVMLLFCSPNALISDPVEKEWTAADIMGKPIIPIFNDPDHIPPLLRTRLGVKFDPFDFHKNTSEIYKLILKKMK